MIDVGRNQGQLPSTTVTVTSEHNNQLKFLFAMYRRCLIPARALEAARVPKSLALGMVRCALVPIRSFGDVFKEKEMGEEAM